MTTHSTATRVCGVLTGALMFLVVAPASAATLTVSNGASPCPGATYTTIQSAIDAATAHDEVTVCAGTYAEQILVAADKDGLVLRSSEPLAAILQAPATMADPGDIVRINAAHDVTLEGFTIAGPLPNPLFCSLFPRAGVRVDGSGSAILRNDRITDIRSEDPALRGCQNGIAILVGSQASGEIGSALIEHDTIEAYEKTGVLVENAGSRAVIVDNRVTGDGPSAQIAQNGIQVSFGADAFVGNNWVSGQIYSPSPLASALLFYLPGHVTVVGNHVHDADFGIATVDATAPEIRDNEVAACTSAGIDLDEDTLGTTCALVVGNESHGNGMDGIYVSASSTNNDLRENRMFADRELDARDDSTGGGTAGTANRWHRDRCKTDNHGGLLCTR